MIQFFDVSKNFSAKNSEVNALQNISLTIQDGDIFGVIGFSGAGKSTLLRMVNALEKPSSGHVEINGQNIDALPYNALRRVRKKIGMIFQQFNLLESKSVYDNIAIPLRLNKIGESEIKKRVHELLQFVNLDAKAESYPSQLSGGQKQRIGIARALATNPSILLCDEATSALDPETTESILQLLERINKELHITILIVTHEIHVIQRLCSHVAVMEHGKVVEQGQVLQVFGSPQQNMTKRFVQTVIPDKIPSSVVEELKKQTNPYKLIKIKFLGKLATDDVLYYINRSYAVRTNVLFATVCELQHTVLGIFIVQLTGSKSAIDEATSYITEKSISWQEVNIA